MSAQEPVVSLLKEHITPLPSIKDPSFSKHFDSFANAKVVLIGDASHGTSEFYAARAEITRHLIEHYGFNIVAVEADWPDAEAVDRYVRRRPGPTATVEPGGKARAEGRDPAFMRFPTWMWRNMEVHDFVEWLRTHNKGRHPKKAVGFYGMDLYSMGASMNAVINYLDQVDPKMANVARQRYGRLKQWAEEPQEYGLEVLSGGLKSYEQDVLKMLKDLLQKRLEYSRHHADGEEFHSGEQNARLVADAEHYYKAMFYHRDESWNLRDTHMFQSLLRVLKHRGDNAKAVVWAHNSHLGNARATSMGWSFGELNIGQLCKETFGSQVVSLGCSTYGGMVAAAENWGGDMEVMQVNPGLPGSYEELMHMTGVTTFMLDLRKGHCDDKLRDELMKKRLERFIGVIYRPDTERRSHYSTAVLPEQFDGLIWFDQTAPVRTLEVRQPPAALEMEETWPFGL
ncbi:Erythromycin esterase type II [Pleurostoma richardsiae]|uniref:Erythromycin esterase type II n=1 Tax=Pleurostoma richardsiae TaxID=41990 RepID=A0AA38R334_9PEZI|nr:Erythromycin esterase type II [Pleurostoma richardsiae]